MASVDRIQGLSGTRAIKVQCRVATTEHIVLSGLDAITGITLVSGDRVLVRYQNNAAENGIYVADTGYWKRAEDFDGANDVVRGTLVPVLGDGIYHLTTALNPIRIGTDPLTFEVYSAAGTPTPYAALRRELLTAVGGETTIALTEPFTGSADGLLFYRDGVLQPDGFSLNSPTEVAFTPAATAAEEIEVIYFNVAGVSAAVVDVVAISAEVATVAGIAGDVTAVAGNATNINAVAGNATNINAVAGNATNINAVAANETDIDTVAGIAADVSAVATIDTDVTAVAGNATNVTTVAGLSADVTTVAGISADVTTVATNVADVTNFADVYQGPKTSDPATRNDGSALQAGDLYFNTVSERMRVYSGSAWADTSPTATSITSTQISDSTTTGRAVLTAADAAAARTAITAQETLVSGTNIKTFNGESLLGSGNISVPDASTSVKGIVQLSTSVSSTSTTLAATPSAVKQAYDLAAAAASATYHAIGSYAFATRDLPTSAVNPNSTVAGSELRMCGAAAYFEGGGAGTISRETSFVSATALPGTWRCMGYYNQSRYGSTASEDAFGGTLWVRVS